MIRRPREYREIAKALATELRMSVVPMSRYASRLIPPGTSWSSRQYLPQTIATNMLSVEVQLTDEKVVVLLRAEAHNEIVARSEFLRPVDTWTESELRRYGGGGA